METQHYKRSVILGIFVAIGITIFIVMVLTLGSQRKVFTSSVTVKAVFEDVNGLKAGNNVWFSGVKIGTVDRIAFSGGSQVDVYLNIEKSSQQYIRKDAKAKVSSDGLIGNKLVMIYDGTPQTPQIEDGDVLTVEKQTGMRDMMNTLDSNNKNLLSITDDFKAISRRIREGEGTLGLLSADEELAGNLESTILTLRRTSENMQRISADVAAYAAKLDDKESLMNQLVTDTIVFKKLRSSVARFDEITVSTNRLLTDLNKNLNEKNTPAGVLLHDEEAGADLKATLKSLKTGSELLNEDLEALQHSFLLRKYFKKKKE